MYTIEHCAVVKMNEIAQKCIHKLYRKRLTQLAWVAETQNIPKKGLFSGLALGWLLGDEL